VDNIYSRSSVSKTGSLDREVDHQENKLTYTEMGSPTHKLVHLQRNWFSYTAMGAPTQKWSHLQGNALTYTENLSTIILTK